MGSPLHAASSRAREAPGHGAPSAPRAPVRRAVASVGGQPALAGYVLYLTREARIEMVS